MASQNVLLINHQAGDVSVSYEIGDMPAIRAEDNFPTESVARRPRFAVKQHVSLAVAHGLIGQAPAIRGELGTAHLLFRLQRSPVRDHVHCALPIHWVSQTLSVRREGITEGQASIP